MKLKELPSAPAENQDCVSLLLATPLCIHLPHPQATDLLIVEEVLRMILEVVNCCLTHNLHNNPHLVYSLLYQRELFEPFRSHPSLIDILHNIDTVSATANKGRGSCTFAGHIILCCQAGEGAA